MPIGRNGNSVQWSRQIRVGTGSSLSAEDPLSISEAHIAVPTRAKAKTMSKNKRHISSINDLTNSEIEEIFHLADEYSSTMADPHTRYQVRGRRNDAGGFILASLFYEPSTRTRFSFEAAMIRLGGSVLASADPATTSAAKGESLADTVRVIENYADLIVIRHPCEGAARAAAEYANVPIINGGDGRHEHPTQTLCDLYTLRQENASIRGLNVLLVGDLKNGRTVHSLVYALARFSANIFTMPAEGLELPPEVSLRLERDFQCTPMPADQAEALLGGDGGRPPIGAVYVASPEGQQFTLLPDLNVKTAQSKLRKRIDVCYVTRPQRERFLSNDGLRADYPVVNKQFLEGKPYQQARVLHPLPRVSELDYELDGDPRGVYFKQAGYGVPVRMALIAKLLGISPFQAMRSSQRRIREIYLHDAGQTLCQNEKCISHNIAEKNLPKKFIVCDKRSALRCLYCETSVPIGFVADKHSRTYVPEDVLTNYPDLEKVVLFSTQEQAQMADFVPDGGRRRRPS
jgi:aspartate carbamoyltransferase catalytic subunit